MTQTLTGLYKKIAFVSNSAWSVYNFRLDVIEMLLDQGHEVIVLAPDDNFSQKLTDLGCRFIALDFNNKTANPISDYRFYRQLRKIYHELKPDHIFHYVIKPNIYGTLAAAAENIPSTAVITGLGYAFAKTNWLSRFVQMMYKKSLHKASEVWFLNNEDASVFLNRGLVNIEKIKVLPGEGINIRHFTRGESSRKRNQRKFTFLMSARLLKSKGVALYADAARILLKKNYDVSFNLIGFFEEGHPDSISPDTIKKWEDEGLIQYKGFARDVRIFLNNADCFVFPSYYKEGVPRSLMEAASMELPVITAYNRGCKEVVLNNSTGFLCRSNNPFDLADKMEKMINMSDEDRLRMGRNGRMHIMRKFDVEQVKEVYVQTLSANHPD